MPDPMQEIMASFFIECEELLEALLDALQLMADGESDVETINVAFRSVHSIKGGAGAFGLDDLVSFAHQFETVMDQCRDGKLQIDDKLIALFFRCSDMLSDLVRCSRDGEAIDAQATNTLIEELGHYAGSQADQEDEEPIDFQPMTLDLDDFGAAGDGEIPDLSDLPAFPSDEEGNEQGLTITFKPVPELYESGNEPLFLLQSLSDLGPTRIDLDFTPPETIDDLQALGKRLSWSIFVDTKEDPSAALEIFEFADGLCLLEVTKGASLEGADTELVLPDLPEQELSEEPLAEPVTPAAALLAEKQEPAAEKPPEKKPAAKAAPTVRVDLERIERLVNLVGELVINQAMISQSIAQENIHPNSPIFSGLDEFMQLTRDIQESVMMIRAQPVKSLFQRMSRIVREASSAVNKNVRLVSIGENTEIDKTAIERLADPLTHMIRNAVDHGLEDTATRLANGKSEVGVIRLSAAHKSGRVIIEVSDDGGGINRERVRAKAIEKGLISEDAVLADTEIDQLLFLPGFSTAAEVSNLSGRGVGMDVVKTQIAALGGRISIESKEGEGSRFSISLPLTLAVLDGMVISVANETLVIPINSIVETLSLSKEDLRDVSPDQKVMRVRDKYVPVLDLGTRLGYRNPDEPMSGTIALLISPEEGQLVALLVDQIEDQRQVVIKGLQDSYGRVPGVAAATILGDGQIALILDPADLVQSGTTDDVQSLVKKVS
ncbi:MAG: chemotaxis protein CheA [Silicimonas sp.]|nr:chemotaxis protein CheA [Silicimonas sp.]